MADEIELRGLAEIERRFEKYPQVYKKAVQAWLDFVLLTLSEKVPPYPPKPASSTYVRTGTLGRSLGSGESGGRLGQAEISTTKITPGFAEARWGTKVSYAPDVIDPRRQLSHMRHWWTTNDVVKRSEKKIVQSFDKVAQKLVKFLEGKGL